MAAADPNIKLPSGKWQYTLDEAGSDDFSGSLETNWNHQLGDWKGRSQELVHDADLIFPSFIAQSIK